MKTKLLQNYIYGGLIVSQVLQPGLAWAQTPGNDINSLTSFVQSLINVWLIPLMITAALINVMWTGVQFIQASSGSPERKKELGKKLFWSVMGLFVIISIWGLLAIIQNSFGIMGGGTLRPSN